MIRFLEQPSDHPEGTGGSKIALQGHSAMHVWGTGAWPGITWALVQVSPSGVSSALLAITLVNLDNDKNVSCAVKSLMCKISPEKKKR